MLGDLRAGGRGVVGGPQVPKRHIGNQQLLADEDQVGVGEVVHPGDHRIQLAVAVLACGDAEQGVTECDGVVLHRDPFSNGWGRLKAFADWCEGTRVADYSISGELQLVA